ncbi:MAG: pyruvate formate lyase family protein, partial [Thermodesulfobacteriota bacterium]|nr:pyruvate formate lyase family protein [Thermodesulfobacteriota bacterium]
MATEKEKEREVYLKKDIKELEERRKWWWAAEKGRSKRLDYLRKAVWKKGRKGGMYEPGLHVDLERPILFTEACKQNENDPAMMKRAKALANVFDNITIFITEQSQIVGYAGSLPNTIMWHNDVASFSNDEVYNDPVLVPPPERESLNTIAGLNNYWAPRDNLGKVLRDFSSEEAVKLMCSVIMWGLPVSGSFGYAGKDYEYYMTGKRAFEDILDEIQERIDEAEQKIEG